jgi:hypothetical protein
MKIYLALDIKSNALKIGKANDVGQRISELQVGNPNELEVLAVIPCKSERHSVEVEKLLHKKYERYHIRGEWFQYNEEVFRDLAKRGIDFTPKKSREPLIEKRQTLFGEEVIFDSTDMPDCFFYPSLKAQTLDKYENLINRKVRYRTMAWPTYGKKLLLPYSQELDKVFISDKKHKQNLEHKRYVHKQTHQTQERQTLNEAIQRSSQTM